MIPETEDREIVVTRVINAPRALVFAAWTQPEHVANWFGPRESTISVQSMNLSPGGRFHITWSGADGSESPFKGAYREIVAPERLVYTDEWEAPGLPPQEAIVTVTFEERGDKTLLTVRTLFSTPEVREWAAQKGFEVGWGIFFDRLDESLPNVTL